jgi:hypothetical protein
LNREEDGASQTTWRDGGWGVERGVDGKEEERREEGEERLWEEGVNDHDQTNRLG